MQQIITDLNWRYATKVFDTAKKITPQDLEILLEAFRLTPSSFGLQPWKLVVVENQDIKNSLVEHSWGQPQISDCSHLLVLCSKTDFSDTQVDEFIADISDTRGVDTADLAWYADMMKWFLSRMAPEETQIWANKQVYIALGQLITVCAQMHIDSCAVEWFIPAKYDEILGLSEKWLTSVVVLPVGYRDESDKYIDLKKVRFPVEKVTEII